MSDLYQLIERLESATGPDEALDLAIARALTPEVICQRMRRWPPPETVEDFTHWKFTASIDAGFHLLKEMFPKLSPGVVQNAHYGHWIAWGQERNQVGTVIAVAESTHRQPAIAVCLVAVRASLALREPVAMKFPNATNTAPTLSPEEMMRRLKESSDGRGDGGGLCE